MSTATRAVTPEDVLSMPDGDRYELIDGELKELHRGQESSWVARQVFYAIGEFIERHGLGWGFPGGVGYQCFAKRRTVLRADVSVIRRDRLAGGPTGEGHPRIPPDLAVEVVSPHDSMYDVEAKVADYLQAGVHSVWVINPRQRTFTIHRLSNPSSPTRLTENNQLRGEEALEGFICQVGDLFPAVDKVQNQDPTNVR